LNHHSAWIPPPRFAPSSFECITLQTPPGTPWKCRFVLTSSNGTAPRLTAFSISERCSQRQARTLKFLLYAHNANSFILATTPASTIFDRPPGRSCQPGWSSHLIAPVACSPSLPPLRRRPRYALPGWQATPGPPDFGSQNIFVCSSGFVAGMVSYVSRKRFPGKPGFRPPAPHPPRTNAQPLLLAFSHCQAHPAPSPGLPSLSSTRRHHSNRFNPRTARSPTMTGTLCCMPTPPATHLSRFPRRRRRIRGALVAASPTLSKQFLFSANEK